MSFKIKLWKEKKFTVKRAHLSGLLICIIFYFAINVNVLFTFGHQFDLNGTTIIQCFATIPSTQWMNTWNTVNEIIFKF